MRKSDNRNICAGLAILLIVILSCAGAGAQAPVGFEKSALTIETGEAAHTFDIELALTPQQKSRGLMFRREMAANAGMLFVYDRDAVVTMWMRNTLIPLDMLFIAADGRIVRIVQRAVPGSEKTISSRERVRAVLELNGGSARKFGIEVGDRVDYPAFRTTE